MTHLPSEKQVILFSENEKIFWDQNKIFLNDRLIISTNDENIDHVKFAENNLPNFLAVSHEKNNDLYHYRLFNLSGELLAHWNMIKTRDVGLPVCTITQNKIYSLSPESQLITIRSFSGDVLNEKYLFSKNDFDHEKKLLFSQTQNGKSYLIGMEFADLNQTENVVLFEGDNDLSPLKVLPLTIPYLVNISTNNIIAISGTVNDPLDGSQHPRLIIIDEQLKKLNWVELGKLPKKMIWYGDKLILIYHDKISILNTSNLSEIKHKNFDENIYPFDVFSYQNSIFILGGTGMRIEQSGILNTTLILMEYDLQNESFFIETLSSNPHKNIQLLKSEKNVFFIQNGDQLTQYKIVN